MTFKIERPRFSRLKRMCFAAGYGCTLFSFAISIALTSNDAKELEIIFQTFLTLAYTLSVAAIVSLIIYLLKSRKFKYEDAIEKEQSQVKRIVYSNAGEEIGIYLKIGIAGFGVSSIFYSYLCMNISSFKYPQCRFVLTVVYYGSQGLFFLAQIIFLLKFNALIMLKYKRLVKLMLTQIIVLDILTWIMVVITKIASKYIKHKDKCSKTQEAYLSKYFLPFIAEFLVLCIAVNYEVLFRIGEVSFITYEHRHSDAPDDSHIDRLRRKHGLIIGIFAVIFVIEMITLFFTVGKKMGKIRVSMIYMFQDILLNAVGILANCVLYHKTVKFQFTYPYFTNNIDIHLLMISSFCSIFFCVQVLVISITNMILYRTNKFPANPDEIVVIGARAANALIELVNILIQTYVITISFYRCGNSEYDKLRRPGVDAIGISIGINFALWTLRSIQIKKGDIFFNDSRLSNIYPINSYQLSTFFLFSSAPMALLYRYHCSVCYSNIYSRMYEDESDRFEMVMRKEGFDESQMESFSSFNGTARITFTNFMNARMRLMSARSHMLRLNSKISEKSESQ